MKVWKKNLIAAAVMITVCSGVYANWLYSENAVTTSLVDTLDADKVLSEEAMVLSGDLGNMDTEAMASDTATDYFSAVRLSRQQARDSAVNLLQEAMAYSDSGKSAESAVELDDIVQTALNEAQIESLVIAKGYQDCVAYMNEEGISVAVSSPEGGLAQEDVAVIADIVMAQSAYDLDDIRVVEVQ